MADTHFVTSIQSAFGRWSAGTSHLSIKSAPLRSLALLSVLCAFPISTAEAQQRTGVFRTPPPKHQHRFVFPFVVVERVPVIIEREVVREVPVIVEPPPPPPPPREPYVVGKTYASLPGGCMKLIEDGGRASYYLCSGEWYRQVGSGGAVTYKAVARP